MGGSGPGGSLFSTNVTRISLYSPDRNLFVTVYCSGVAISPETSIISKLALSGDLPSHQSICRIFVKFNRKYSTGVRELLSGEEVQTQKNRLVRPVFCDSGSKLVALTGR
ncbi:hypothetical protein ELR49_24175 (plasmid) [Shigella sonnei]|nr:hypothetical protein ELR49_24175 [Shigella sonnei]